MSLGPFALAIAVGVLLAGLALLVNSGRAPRTGGEVAPNLSPYKTDDELESTHLTKTLSAALFSTAFLAVIVPLYFLGESNRQEFFTEQFDETAVELGHEAYLAQSEENPHGFGCINCHGADGVGGVAAYTDARTGVTVSWKAPSLNDVLYRYTDDEIRYWLVYGRQNSPMPAWGIEAGGPMNDQQIDEVIEYLHSIQLPQEEALAKVNGLVDGELAALEQADQAAATRVADQQELVDDIRRAPDQYAVAQELQAQLDTALAASTSGPDRDRDGLSDDSETTLTRLSERAVVDLASRLNTTNLEHAFDPENAFTNLAPTGEPLADEAAAAEFKLQLDTLVGNLAVTTDNFDRILAAAEDSLAKLEDLQTEQRWSVDFQEVADEAFGGDVDEARRAYGLYSAYCARCHTAGYSPGIPFTLEPGSGALGPALREGRSITQFPDRADQIDFIVKGSQNGVGYGVNGIGRGWMPGFGEVLSEADIERIVDFERSLR